jgi:hypothetical protein
MDFLNTATFKRDAHLCLFREGKIKAIFEGDGVYFAFEAVQSLELHNQLLQNTSLVLPK